MEYTSGMWLTCFASRFPVANIRCYATLREEYGGTTLNQYCEGAHGGNVEVEGEVGKGKMWRLHVYTN